MKNKNFITESTLFCNCTTLDYKYVYNKIEHAKDNVSSSDNKKESAEKISKNYLARTLSFIKNFSPPNLLNEGIEQYEKLKMEMPIPSKEHHLLIEFYALKLFVRIKENTLQDSDEQDALGRMSDKPMEGNNEESMYWNYKMENFEKGAQEMESIKNLILIQMNKYFLENPNKKISPEEMLNYLIGNITVKKDS